MRSALGTQEEVSDYSNSAPLAGNRNTTGAFNNRATNANFWSSSQSGSNAWNRNLNSSNATVNRNTNSKANGFSVRCLKDREIYIVETRHCLVSTAGKNKFMVDNYSQLKLDLFRAYYDARKNKRNKLNSLAFEIDYEKKLLELADEIWNRRYSPGQSVCFISHKPVKREIFAASFRDRVVHHLIYSYINPIFERLFINDSYSCRPGKGTSYGIKRLDHFIRSCSENYKKDCYILKLDIRGYFMSINRKILYDKIEEVLCKHERERERERERVNSALIYFLT